MSPTETVITVDNISYSYGSEPVLTAVSLKVNEGDFVGIIGPNGGGKTTLLRLILGVLSPQQGSITLLGHAPALTRAQVGYIPQETSSNKAFPISVFDVVLMGTMGRRGLFHSYCAADRDRAASMLDELNIGHLKNKSIGELSGGQRQKALLARALVSQPKILFLDEPTASIDTRGQDEIYEYLRAKNNAGTTVLLVTHNVGAVSSYIKSIACVNKDVFFHPDGKLDEDTVTKAYGCPVDIIAHGLPHRVFHCHDGHSHA